MGWVDIMENESNYFSLMFSDTDSRRYIFAVLAMFLLTSAYQTSVFYYFKSEEIIGKYDVPSWDVSFESVDLNEEETQIIADGTISSYFLEIDESKIMSNSYVGFLNIVVSYEETSGNFADPCDFVSVNLRPEGILAEWDNESNSLSGSSDQCTDILLFVQIYPSFDGSNVTVVSDTIDEALDHWSNETYGMGELNLEVEVNTQQRVEGLPTQQDTDEAVTVSWRLTTFVPTAKQLDV
uniref:Uncharacterized protein n=1 Tax=uncultured archaeon MedDCM-OCT-S11-C441 TaxID=743103 RepID=D6PCA0_9ARCH|nr:hypothetical protein [uncultured archaeon MedDCM-OCT-S11-C441]